MKQRINNYETLYVKSFNGNTRIVCEGLTLGCFKIEKDFTKANIKTWSKKDFLCDYGSMEIKEAKERFGNKEIVCAFYNKDDELTIIVGK